MKGKPSVEKENSYIVLDIRLGGVSGAIVTKNNLEHRVHIETPIPQQNTVPELITKTSPLLREVLKKLTPKKKVSKTYIFIDAPLSYSQTQELIFQDDDKSFYDSLNKEIMGEIDLPSSYKNILGEYIFEGVIIEHAPESHTLNGYPTKNLKQKGEKRAFVTQQWIQKSIFDAIQEIQKFFLLGEVVFVHNLNKKDIFLLGDVISSLTLDNKTILIGLGTRLLLLKYADNMSISYHQVEGYLKSIEKKHKEKDSVYQNILEDFIGYFTKALKKENIVGQKTHTITYVGEELYLSVTKDSLIHFKNIQIETILKGKDARLIYIAKNNVQ